MACLPSRVVSCPNSLPLTFRTPVWQAFGGEGKGSFRRERNARASSRAPRVSLAPKTPFPPGPFPSLSNVCHAGYEKTEKECQICYPITDKIKRKRKWKGFFPVPDR